MKFKSPLTLYIIWHPQFADGKLISQKLFGLFCRDIESPFNSRMGIPVYFRSAISNNGQPLAINFDESERNVIICLIDTKLINDRTFTEYIVDTYTKQLGRKLNRFIPVALTKAAFNFDSEVGKLNYIRAYEADLNNKEALFSIIYHNLLHELCKLFINPDGDRTTNQPVKLFISHSKHDSVVNEALAFRDYVNSSVQLKTFFDSNDIGFGDDFGKTIEENAGKCVIVAFLSDTYASREWCRNEIIIAKKNHCPIITVNAVQKGEKRSFPYLGNAPTVRWDGDSKTVVNLALEVTLYVLYKKEAMEAQAKLYGVDYDFILSSYPELFSIIGIKQKMIESDKEAALIIYPDPPLGNEELTLLNQMDDRIIFITPLQLSAFL